jgi:hypothetical protein
MTKYIIIFLTIISAFASSKANIDFSVGYRSSIPINPMRENLKSANGLDLGINYKFCLSPFSVGADFGVMSYGSEKAPYFLESPSGNYITETSIKVSNSMNIAMINSRAYLNGYGMKVVNPYVVVGFGMASFRTNLRIEDPEDIDGCALLVSEKLHKDRTWATKVGAGVTTDLFRLFAKNKGNSINHNRYFLDIGVNYLTGGKVTYIGAINSDFVNNYNHNNPGGGGHHHHNQGNSNYDGPRGFSGTLDADFEHLPTGEIHSHAVGNKYSNRLNMIGLNISLLIRIGNNCRY